MKIKTKGQDNTSSMEGRPIAGPGKNMVMLIIILRANCLSLYLLKVRPLIPLRRSQIGTGKWGVSSTKKMIVNLEFKGKERTIDPLESDPHNKKMKSQVARSEIHSRKWVRD